MGGLRSTRNETYAILPYSNLTHHVLLLFRNLLCRPTGMLRRRHAFNLLLQPW